MNQPCYDHLVRLTDDVGIFEHALGAVPRREHGYTTDDNARALMLILEAEDSDLDALAWTYLSFLLHAHVGDGVFRNRLGYDRRWRDEGESDDASGRALWALARCVATGPDELAFPAQEVLESGHGFTSSHLRSACFGVLAGCELLRVDRYDPVGRRLVETNLEVVRGWIAGTDQDPDWPWPEDRLRYDNARIPQALLEAGRCTGDGKLVDRGVRLLDWLWDVQTRGSHLSVVSHLGWERDGPRLRFDQQPLELAALADAAWVASAITGDDRWVGLLEQAWGWFEGDNDLGVRMYDPVTCGAYDGLTPDGPNRNQGAESTISMLTTLQRARVGVRRGGSR